MKLEKILNQLNSLEKNPFLKVVDNILSEDPKFRKKIDKILVDNDGQLKNTDNANIAGIFELIACEFTQHVSREFFNTCSQLDILIDIIIRDGNGIMSREWFANLYAYQIETLKKRIKVFTKTFEGDAKNVDDIRIRDYKIYFECVKTAFYNDEENNQEPKITQDELSLLVTLAKQLNLSQEEIRLINYMVVPLEKLDVDTIINDLKYLGLIFYHKKNHQLFVADEVVSLMRAFRGKVVADKHFRRVLYYLKDGQLNLVCRRHNIDRTLIRKEKVNEIIKQGINFSDLLLYGIFKDGISQTEIKNVLNTLIFKELNIESENKGKTAEEKVNILIDYFNSIDKDQKIKISYHGYDKLLHDLNISVPGLNKMVKEEYELQDEFVLKNSFLMDYNIKPLDVLYLLNNDELITLSNDHGIKTRGDSVTNILHFYKDIESLFLENYDAIANRDYNNLKENDIVVREADIGVKFEELTKLIFGRLGFHVDEGLRKKLANNKNKVDMILNVGNNEIIIIECKTVKDSGYNKYSSVSRQIKAYMELAEKSDYRVIKSLLIAPNFSDDFEKECGLEYELNLSLITSGSLKAILDGFTASKHKVFPYKLLLRDVLIKEDRILKAIAK
ncbi:MAG: hypothetical protein WD555_00450 [Fulvivirga sp.]